MASFKEFLFSVAEPQSIPLPKGKEVALFGSSNVGKSSLINSLFGIKNLARTSKTPGRTQLINFFSWNENNILVDVPGYGFANVPNHIRKTWDELLGAYIQSRGNILKGYVLVDSRRYIKQNDMDVILLFQQNCISFQIVMTKSDKLNATERKLLNAKIEEDFGDQNPAIVTSTKTKEGIDLLNKNVNEWFDKDNF